MEQTTPLVETLFSAPGGRDVDLIVHLEKCTQGLAEILRRDESYVAGRRGGFAALGR